MSDPSFTQEDIKELYDKICLRLEQYAAEKRANTQPQRLVDQLVADPNFSYDPKDDRVREALIEHVGVLPIIATTIFPYLKDADVDLGEALIMLAVHDIGETVTGDTIEFKKSEQEDEDEQSVALELLETEYHELYKRVENPEDPTACFAKSVDKLAGNFLDQIFEGELILERYRAFMDTDDVDKIIAMVHRTKRDKMTWHPLINSLYEYCMQQFQATLKLAER